MLVTFTARTLLRRWSEASRPEDLEDFMAVEVEEEATEVSFCIPGLGSPPLVAPAFIIFESVIHT